ncbi:ABC transporter permease [Streptomyces iconiensis]|uniref:ABC-2 family transporter protein n=1 Tax=Streptomyces iconiensis TaxID=1384038 RepID=A0ABT6ZXX2_9ACTN|nr:ABC-2 family transporter protein [Streptomyces iconiensis]MDJ1133258.1 ABC-2 family transporter protein [Streptomyces iconiensis]
MRLPRLYFAVAGSGFRRYATYRMATAAGVFTNTIFGFILAYTFIALWNERPQLGGYDQSQALTFVWIGQALLASAALMGGGFQDEFQERIRTGDVAIDLYRPIDLQMWWLASDLGRAAFHLVGRGVVPLVVGAFAFELALPGSLLVWALFLLSVFLGVVVSFALRYLFALCGFWLLDASGLGALSMLLSLFFSGMMLPLNVFPGALGEIVRWLPWAATLQVPADVLLGVRQGGAGIAGAFGFQSVWALVLLGCGRLLQKVATRRVVVQGG